MALLMLAASVYGVAQLLVLSSPSRSVRIGTVLLAIAVGVYGCGIATALLEYAYTRAIADQPSGGVLIEAVQTAGYTVDPVVEELVKVTPLLLAAWNIKVRRQWGLTDYVVTGAALGAGFGLLEAVARYGLSSNRAIGHPDGGWIIPKSLIGTPYIPGPDQLLFAWFPAPAGSLGAGGLHPAAQTSPHLVYTAVAALGVGVLIRARGWPRIAGLLPVTAACAHHILANYSVRHPADRDVKSLVELNGLLWAIPLICLAIAVIADVRQIRQAKRTVPGVLTQAERAGRTGLEH
ncbi:PrsW family glutamic-type intramembrane protease [Streptomyces sp. NPDC007983]|uniref:PrsW family glutamic-type intramembrane protease n=1 Tax=Streptomyces sp. NPDC007983 TaxID=3364800 RepID=UPI0036F0B01D